ncbi:MAG: DUF4358 domain-containing protein [Ruminococcus sp.]|nr:DUF4358 domain-containing protein [Ruminococcus sp.]
MKIRKTVCVLLAALAVCCSFAACGGNDDGGSSDKSTAAVQQDSVKDAGAVADEIKNAVEFEDDLVEFDSAKIAKILGIEESSYKKAKVYASSSGATPEEIACFDAADKDSASAIKSALDSRLENQKKTFTDYKPEQKPKLDSAVVKVKGESVYYIVSGDSAKAEEIIG